MPAPTSTARHQRRGWTWLAGLLTALGFTALSMAPAEAAQHEVEIEQYAYGPSSLSVTQGDTVTWTNRDSVEHDVVVSVGPASFRSPLLKQGESWSYTFTTPGNYSYICSIHPDMRATVSARAVVAPPTTAAPTPTPTPTPEAAPTTPGKRATTPSPSTVPTPPAPTPTQPAVTTTTPTAATTTTLNPLLLVAGAAVAVVVFCLLLMASRPVYETPAAPTEPTEPPEPAEPTKTDDET